VLRSWAYRIGSWLDIGGLLDKPETARLNTSLTKHTDHADRKNREPAGQVLENTVIETLAFTVKEVKRTLMI
jgi:hypothetical protein